MLFREEAQVGRDQEDPAAPVMFGQLSKAEMLALVKEQALSKQKKTERPVRTIQEKIKFYATFSFSLVAITGFSVLMFLVPFIVDPALATLTADFVVSKGDKELKRLQQCTVKSACAGPCSALQWPFVW